ncbi:hypothetical protein OIU85_007283 [Salix viminalis]|uniref:Non-haem dioxygenase N-terminal domain-containing protein n=1 Tax=Salix viminalis TaxID=40686 RepID=A0A9Q0P993_SALVM|nr:hypothetical protein OIU85_007283 [Salix viminalis]
MVINHGVPQKLLSSILDGCRGFFDLAEEEKQEFKGSHVLDPIRSGTSFNVSVEKAFYWRDFLHSYIGMKYEDYLELQQSNKLDGKSCLDRVRISAV